MSKKPFSNKEIITYYQASDWLYKLFCFNQHSLGLHYGLWDTDTKNRHQAILNQNQEVINLAKITQGQKVLDLGCGVGGTAIYIANKTGAHVTGISIDPQQVKQAMDNSQRRGLSKMTDFKTMDFMQLDFPKSSFDVVYAIEAACYAFPKKKFLAGVYRVLKPGGMVVFMDGYLYKKPKNDYQQQVLDNIVWGFRLAPMVTGDKFLQLIKKTGFKKSKMNDMTAQAMPSTKYFNFLAKLALPITKILSFLPINYLKALHWNAVALRNVALSYDHQIGQYCSHVGKK